MYLSLLSGWHWQWMIPSSARSHNSLYCSWKTCSTLLFSRIACSLIYRRASANVVEAYSASDLIYRCVTVLIRIFIPRILSIRHPPNLEIIKTPEIITANRILISRDRPAARSAERVAPNYARSSTEIYALVHDGCVRNKLVIINFVTSDSSIWPDLSSMRAEILPY